MLEATTVKGDGRRDATKAETGARIKEAFERLKANRWRMAAASAQERIARLVSLRHAILRRRGELEEALRADYRKPSAEAELTELQPVLAEIKHTIKHLRHWMEPVPVSSPPTLFGTRSMLRYEPKGVVLLLSPWNYPFNLLLAPLVSAIAAGNCVMCRPSDKVPATSRFVASLLQEVFPENEVAIFTGPSWIATLMLELPFDHVMFTGSTRIGRDVMAAASKHLASVTLELGGQCPVVIDETADVEAAAERVVWGKYLNAGQTCVAPNHVFVHESRATEFIEVAKRTVAQRYGGTEDERRKSEDLCRIVDPGSVRKLHDLIERSVAAGATLEIGGVHDVEERYLAPTILSGVKDGSPIMQDEIFGPVLPILSYRNLDDVLGSIRSRGKPLALYVFSSDRSSVERILAGTTAGGSVVNNVILHLANPELPFGGVGESGLGSYHGFYGFKNFSHERAVLVQGRPALLGMFYPPYTRKVRRAIGLVTRFFS
ncbi:MAG: aldehyde dehydrogenase family protein [Deltaproteobacteria bacterium]|nr:aldehyde dehydrogenase family protein [Deltaproteobacteria bacterium]